MAAQLQRPAVGAGLEQIYGSEPLRVKRQVMFRRVVFAPVCSRSSVRAAWTGPEGGSSLRAGASCSFGTASVTGHTAP